MEFEKLEFVRIRIIESKFNVQVDVDSSIYSCEHFVQSRLINIMYNVNWNVFSILISISVCVCVFCATTVFTLNIRALGLNSLPNMRVMHHCENISIFVVDYD